MDRKGDRETLASLHGHLKRRGVVTRSPSHSFRNFDQTGHALTTQGRLVGISANIRLCRVSGYFSRAGM